MAASKRSGRATGPRHACNLLGGTIGRMLVPLGPGRLRLRRRSVIAGALAGFGLLFLVVKANRTAAVDLAVSLRIQGARSSGLAAAMTAASWPGFPPQSRIIPPAIIGAWWLSGHRRAAAFQVAAWGTGLLSTGAKMLVQRARPIAPQVRVVVAPLGGTSFPSGHVLTYVGFYGFLAYLVSVRVRPAALRRTLVGLLIGLLGLVGPSRVQQGHHWATDVLASYLLGLAYVLGLVTLYERVSAPRGVGGVLGERSPEQAS